MGTCQALYSSASVSEPNSANRNATHGIHQRNRSQTLRRRWQRRLHAASKLVTASTTIAIVSESLSIGPSGANPRKARKAFPLRAEPSPPTSRQNSAISATLKYEARLEPPSSACLLRFDYAIQGEVLRSPKADQELDEISKTRITPTPR